MLYWRVSDRSQSTNEQYSNTVKDDFFTQHHQPKYWKLHTTRLDDNTIPQIKIKINEILFAKKLYTTCYHKPQCPACYLISGDQIGKICLGGLG